MSSYTTTIPLTTVFTPPADCESSFTYEGTYYNDDPRGVLMQNLLANSIDSTCFPSSWFQYGRAGDELEVYSPGWCPVGYSTAQQGFSGAMTTAVCCPSGYAYTTYYAGINYMSESQEFRGCTSTYSSGLTTVVPARAGDTDLSTTTVSGPIGMWAQPITVAFRQQDLALFTTSSILSATTTASTSNPTLTAASSTVSSVPTSPSTGSSSSDSSLSGGAIAGIAIGAAAVLGILIGLALFFRRKKSKSHDTNPSPGMEWQSSKPEPPSYQSPAQPPYRDLHPSSDQTPPKRYFAEADPQPAMIELDGERRRAELAG